MIQLARIEAEIASWPFWSEASIEQGITALHWDAYGNLDRSSRALYAALEEYLRLRCGGASLETLQLIRDRIWRDEARTQERSLLSVLRSVARELWRVDESSTAQPCIPNQYADRLRRFTLTMPLDLLTAAAGHAGSVEIIVPELREILQRGVAQVHVHLGACMSFATLWEHMMVTAGAPFLDPVKLERGGPPPFGNGKEFRRWLVTAALVRATLAGFLYWQERGRVQQMTQFVDSAWLTEFERRQHRLVLDSFLRGSLTASAERAASLYRRMSGVSGTDAECPSLADLRQRDPIRRWLDPQADEEADSTLFRQAFAYLDSACDPNFARLFWQYVRVRGRTYRYIVQESGTAGLDWFSRHFLRISGVRNGMSRRARMESAYELEGQHLRLSSLEVRETPEADPIEIRQIVREIVKARPVDRQTESGVVLHFKKEWRDSRGRPHADPRRSSIPCRYGLYALHRLREVHAIRDTIQKPPSLLNWLRGLDMCSEELSVPNWVLLPMLGLLRKQSQEIAANETRQGRPCEGLRMTLHCGEDFRSLNEGLRRLHEPIEFGYLQRRDRVGHALALGIDVDRFLGQQPYSVERAEDRLENLLWELSLYESAILHPKGDRRRSIETKIQKLGRDIYGEDVAPQVHQEARALRMRGWQMDHWRYPRMYAPFATKPAERILLAYLCDPDVYQNGQRPVETSNQNERGFLLDAQRMLRAAFRTRQITIEANPSSNLLIGNFSELAQLPIFQLAQPRTNGWLLKQARTLKSDLLVKAARMMERTRTHCCWSQQGEADLSVAIADDDPLTFATSLHQEYVYAYSALLEMECTQQAALEWIDQRRRQSIDARFTLDASRSVTEGRKS